MEALDRKAATSPARRRDRRTGRLFRARGAPVLVNDLDAEAAAAIDGDVAAGSASSEPSRPGDSSFRWANAPNAWGFPGVVNLTFEQLAAGAAGHP